MTLAEYRAQVCMYGATRADHAYTYVRDGDGTIVMRIMPMGNERCGGFIDAIEREIGYPAGIAWGNDGDQDVGASASIEAGGN